MFNCCVNTGKSKVIKVDFGRVSAGTSVTRSVKICNESCRKQSYEAQRDPTTNPLDYFFNLEPYKWTLLPGGTFKCKIRYQPILPSYRNTDYFVVTDCDHMRYKIVVHGTCIGPNVSSSIPKLVMVCPKGTREVRKRIELTNNSDVTANFMFDIDEAHCPFKVDTMSGFIEPHNHLFVIITFLPSDRGLYAFYLPCLILNQGPVIVELYGYYGPLFSREDEFHLQIFTRPMPKLRDFEGYMSDSLTVREGTKPPISLSYIYLDFGQADYRQENTLQNISQTVCFTNHTSMNVSVKWDKDREEIFCITPSIAQIRAKQSALFEARFNPSKPDALYARELIGRIFWESKLAPSSKESPPTVTIPLVASVRMIGHSFPALKGGWMPQYEVPHTVILPPCLPPLPVYTTFLIRKYGHLPMLFRFIPPHTSHFTVKPMVGIMQRDYQIIALEMFPEEQGELVYVERWAVQFNGNPKYEVSIDFRGFAEYPNLNFNDDRVEFAPVHLGCTQTKQMIIRNTTRHCIRYSFPNLPSELCIVTPIEDINPNEIRTLEWLFYPSCLGEYEFTIDCHLTTIRAGCPVGTNVIVHLQAVGRSELGFLAANPEELNFEAHAYNETRTLSFHVFNFSSVKISYKMVCIHRGWPTGDTRRDIRIHPTTGTVCLGKKERIDVYITPKEPGFYQLVIQYFLRRDFMAEDIIRAIEPRNICKINCMCVLPIFEIKDLLHYGSGPGVSKVMLWNLLRINEFNSCLKSIMPGERTETNMFFPAFQVHEEPLFIKLLVVNPTPVQSTWAIHRIQLCSCKQSIKTRGFSFNYMEYDCGHRLTCSIYPKKGSLKPYEKMVLTMEVRYILLGKTQLQWDLTLANDRHVIINAEIITMSGLENYCMLLYGRNVTFENINIGDMDPIYQIKWMYNNLDSDVKYSVDVGPLNKLNRMYLGDVLLCKNPHGIVPGLSCKPVIIRFQPRMFGVFEVTVPIMLGEKSTEMVIRVESHCLHEWKMLTGKIPFADTFSIPEVPLSFNTDYVLMPPIPVHSVVSRMIMIHNESQHHVIGYEWKSYELPGIIEMEVMPRKGRIQPGDPISFRLTVITSGHPCKIRADVTCEFLDITDRRTHEKDVFMYNALCKELEGQFTITEKGETAPEPWFTIAPKPVPFHKAISVSCYVYGTQDTDLKITLQEQLKSTPAIEVPAPKYGEIGAITDKQIAVVTFVLEGMIWDILNSEMFRDTVKQNVMKVKKVNYSQFVMSLKQRRNLMKRSYSIPSQRYIEAILEDMIFMIVHEEFALDVHHLDHPPDVRQTMHFKMIPQVRQQMQMESPYRGGLLTESLTELSRTENESSELVVTFNDQRQSRP